MIELQGVNKYYGSFQVLKDLSLKVNQGEIVGFLGPNGAGKTTTMRILTGFMPATSRHGDRRRLSTWFSNRWRSSADCRLPARERPALHRHDRARVPGLRQPRPSGSRAASARPAIARVAGQCGLDEVLDRLIGSLSKGYRQRVGLAQALIHDPRC